MFLIHNTLGEDAKIFDTDDEEPTPSKLYEKIQQNLDKELEESFYTKALNEFTKIKQRYPDLISALDKFPHRVKVAKNLDENELFVFIKKGRLYVHCMKYGKDNKNEFIDTTFEDIFEKISCTPEKKLLELSKNFWEAYEEVKNFRNLRIAPVSEKSLEQQAINILKTFINNTDDRIFKIKDFINMLLEDIQEYGTLPDYTLRKIANLETGDEKKLKKSVDAIKQLKNELGQDYLEKEKSRQKDISKEIIVAIENQHLS